MERPGMDNMERPSMEEEDFDREPYRDDMYSGDMEQGHDDDGDFQGTARSTVVQNQPHDEEVALSDTESFAGPEDPPAVPADASLIESHDMEDMPPMPMERNPGPQAPLGRMDADAYDVNTREEGDAGPQEGTGGDDSVPAGAYNAQEYKHLNVPDEIRDLFQYIGRYKPQNIDLETKLKPFIPDYIPAVGGIDEFIKVPRPDGKPDFLGLKVLDEPAAHQSDPTVLTLQLRQLSKEAPGNKAEMVGRVEHTDDNKNKKISQWIGSILDIHKAKPAATVSYSRKMPEIEALMQEWPPEMEQFLKGIKLPSGDLDLDLIRYTKLICSLLDIPVYENPVESLHVLFTLYLEFKNNPIFRQHMEMENRLDGSQSMVGDETAGLYNNQTPATAMSRGADSMSFG